MNQPTNNDSTIGDVLEAVNYFATKTEERFNRIEATMVTKDYLDDKLANLKGDIIIELRHEDKKLGALVGVLLNRKVISQEDAKDILAMKPFPQHPLAS